MISIILSFIHYPMAIGRYFELALRRNDKVKLVTAGPYSGTYIPWNFGMHLPQEYAIPPDIIVPSNQGNAQLTPIGYVESQLPAGFKPDIWLQIDAGFRLTGKPESGKNFIVGTDPHVLNYDRQRLDSDIFFCMQAHYAKPGDQYLPYAYDPIYHAKESQPCNFDACLLGLHYKNRDRLVAALRNRGLEICYDLGPCFNEARALYNQAPIGLNWSSKQDLTARVFELLGMGRLAVVNRVPDLAHFFEDGTHLVAFDSLDEAIEKTMYYHERPGELGTVAEAGHKAVRDHTWDDRIEQVLSYA